MLDVQLPEHGGAAPAPQVCQHGHHHPLLLGQSCRQDPERERENTCNLTDPGSHGSEILCVPWIPVLDPSICEANFFFIYKNVRRTAPKYRILLIWPLI